MHNPIKNRLYQLISDNTFLRYLDNNGDSYSLSDLADPVSLPSSRGLAFLYLDNSIASVSLLLHFLQQDWTFALLPPNLAQPFKERLELRYQPNLIYDKERSSLKRYHNESWHYKTGLFYADAAPEHNLHPQLKLLLSTSGTTGSPKFVKLSEQNIVQNALSIVDYLPIRPTDVTPLNLPLFYSYGLSVFTSNSICGGKLVCTNSDIMQKEFWREMERFGYTSLAGVPYVYELLARLGFLQKDYPQLRYLTQAGGKLSKELLSRFAQYAQDKQLDFFVMYGQTEATARMSFLASDDLVEKLGSIGKPIKNGQFHLDPESSELLYTGPNIFGGYAEGPDDLQHFDPPASLATGDLARQDQDGFYYITGRIKRIVKLFGTRINLDEVEQLLISQFPGKELACVGTSDKYINICYADQYIQEDAIKELLFKRVHILPQVVRFQKLPSLLRTNNGKVDYHAITTLIADSSTLVH
ncbi:AMP-binding protein [Sphingobacterium sp.]|uniref:AMP-binding protein n=1 Tax=Sphingobacterium sp. TaxID=341027 RepID=UPI002897FBC0|nr:AMP-binding protein [Sphingobacterium sp.]